ncbi:MAG: FtsX-like permease family protein [Mucinivorans sp.]
MKNFILAYRTLKNYRLYSVVNIIGLALSLSCTIVLARHLYREFTVDSFNKNLDRIYAITLEKGGDIQGAFLCGTSKDNRNSSYIDPLLDPSIIYSTELLTYEHENLKIGVGEFRADVMLVDSNFLKVFDYQLLMGDRSTAMRGANSAIITADFANRHFPGQDPMGRTIMHPSGREVVVEGVVATPPSKSLFRFDILISRELQKYWSHIGYGFVLVVPNTSIAELNLRHEGYMEVTKGDSYSQRHQFVPLQGLYFDRYLNTDHIELFNKGNRAALTVLLVVALLVLLVGVFNFVNIYTVLLLRRNREIGVKKVFGAATRSIIRTLYVENLVMIALSIFLGWALVDITRGVVQSYLGISMVGSTLFDVGLSLGMLLVLPLLTTIYPYFKYRYAKPITSLRQVGGRAGSSLSRAVFMVLQYVITVVMIIISLYFVRQLDYMLSSDLGFNSDRIIQTQMIRPRSSWDRISETGFEQLRQHTQYIRQQMDSSPLFEQWTYGELPLVAPSSFHMAFSVRGEPSKKLNLMWVNKVWLDMFKVPWLSGESFSDSTSQMSDYKLIATPATLKLMGVTDYSSVMLQPQNRLWWSSEGGDMSQNPPYAIIGLVGDMYTTHLSVAASPIVMAYSNKRADFSADNSPLLARIVRGREAQAIDFLRSLHQKVDGGEFTYTFAKDEIRKLYDADSQVALIYSVFAIIAIFISSLGLFSLSLYDVQQRYREIALRRVNGARVGQIVFMLLRRYYLLLLLSFVLAMPLAWWVVEWYTADFAVRAPLSWWIFALAALITVSISLLTLIFQTIRAAHTNPASSLKTQ